MTLLSQVHGLGALTALHELYLTANALKAVNKWPALPIFELHIGTCIGIYVGMCVGMCVGICVGMCVGMCIGM